MDITRFLNQSATYNTPGDDDGFGGKTGGVASSVPCRWVDEHNIVIGLGGKEVLSKAVIITENTLEVEGHLLLIGGVDDQRGIIQAVARIPSVNADQYLNKAWIK